MRFTKEEKEWIANNCPLLGFKEATLEYNKIFNENRSYDTIRTYCKRNGIKVNKDIKTKLYRNNRSSKNRIYVPGEIFIQKGYKYIKFGYGKDNHQLYSRYLYEQEYGELSSDYSVLYLDGDPMNCELDNLIAVENRVKTLLSVYKMWSTDREIMRTAIKWCELRLHLLDTGVLNDLKEKEKESKYYDGVDLGAIQQKVQAKSKSGVKGVTWDKSHNKWRANIEFRGKAHHLGRFENIDDAIKARKDAEDIYFNPIIAASKGGIYV